MDNAKDAVLNCLLYLQQKNSRRIVGFTKPIIARGLRSGTSGRSFGDFDPAVINMAIDYLDDKKYLKSTTQQGVKFYRLSDKAQDQLFGVSAYSNPSNSFRVTNNYGVIMTGGANYGSISIDSRQTILYSLEELAKEAEASGEISDINKATITQNILTIENQIKAPAPDESIISKAWSKIDKLASTSGAIQLVQMVANAAVSLSQIFNIGS